MKDKPKKQRKIQRILKQIEISLKLTFIARIPNKGEKLYQILVGRILNC